MLYSIYQQIWKTQQQPQHWKRSVFIPVPKKGMSKNVQTTIQLCLFHMLVRLCSKFFKLGFSSMWTENFQTYKLSFKEAEEPEIKLPTFFDSWRNQGNSRNTSTSPSLTDYTKAFVCVDHNKLWKILRLEYQITLPVSWEVCVCFKKQQLDQMWNNGLVQNWERNMTRLYSVTLFI